MQRKNFPQTNDEALEEQFACLMDFSYWAKRYCRIEDKETHEVIPFELYPCQSALIDMMQRGEWPIVLKSRRLGVTWAFMAFAVWTTMQPNRSVSILNQNQEYAQDNLARCRTILANLPTWLKHPTIPPDKQSRITFSNGSEIRSFAPTLLSMRSIAADLVLCDEAGYIKYLRECLRAAEPTVETANGQIALFSTSSGPSGSFYEEWDRASVGKSKFKPIFFDWSAHPKRTPEWYEAESKAHEHDPLHMKREYPRTPEEAFESAEGRIYPLFTRDHNRREIAVHSDWKKYRGIDFGGADPFVCLWGCVIPGDGPALTYDPSCTEFLREMLAYSWSDKGDYPEPGPDHCPDVCRYIVSTFDIRGHLHIYRELYVPDSAAKGLSLPMLAERVKEMSGEEYYSGGVADRSRPDSILELRHLGIQCEGQAHLSGANKPEIVQGIAKVNALVVGTDAKGYPDIAKRPNFRAMHGVRFG